MEKTQTDALIADAFRRWGYLEAALDPLGRLQPAPHPELAGSGPEAETLRKYYCGSIGAEFMQQDQLPPRLESRRICGSNARLVDTESV